MTFSNFISAGEALFSRYYKKWYVGLLLALLITAVAAVLQRWAFMQGIEAKTLDMRFAMNSPPPDAAAQVALIGIDDSSLNYFADNGISWPWPRDFYAHLLNYLTDAGARAVLFDLLFYQPDLDRGESEGAETDAAFAAAIKANGKVVLGAQLSNDEFGFPIDLAPYALDLKPAPSGPGSRFRSLIAPVSVLCKATNRLGIVNISPDPDGVIRRVPLAYAIGGRWLPQMALGGLLTAGHRLGRYDPGQGYLELDTRRVPIDSDGDYDVYWYGRNRGCDYLACATFGAAMQSASAVLTGEKPQIPSGFFKDKIVIVGATAAGLMDLKTTPAARIQPGMEIWATILLNLLRGDFVRTATGSLNALITVIVAFGAFLALTRLSGVTSHLLVLAIPLLIGLETAYLWRAYRLAVSLSMPASGFLLSYLLYMGIGYFFEGRSKRKISQAMSRYLHPDLVHIIAQDPERVDMGGQEVEASVLFSDIYNFTTISETYSPQQLVSHLNAYFSDLSRIILDYGGMLDKYMGDGIMAIFGAPLPKADHAVLACRAALAHKEFSNALACRQHGTVSEQFHCRTRLGIHSGRIVAGNIGSSRRMDYTAIGDTVNLASRLEGVNKIYNTKIIISEACQRLVADEFILRELDYLRVKGKKEPTRIYELIGRRQDGNHPDLSWIDDYQAALELYRQGKWEAARARFEALAAGALADSASAVMLQRCRFLVENPPKQWDGILTLEVK
jgi:adenylate cyclase